MLTTIKGVYNNGQIILEELPETDKPVEVLVTFTEKVVKKDDVETTRKFGFGKGSLLYMSPDFNEPLDDLKDYM
ncbi:MAG TPA: hypothetical protein PKE30_17380 [Niabella sp.]|nr:hypothetical protein [Niabella sp.]